MNDCNRVIEALENSKMFRESSSAFCEITGVRLYLEPTNYPPQNDCEKSSHNSGLNTRHSSGMPEKVTLIPGMYRLVVPIKHGAQIVAIIRTGLIFETSISTNNLLSRIPVIPKARSKSLVKLIALFAAHLGTISNQLVLQQENCEPAFILRAKQYIQTHRGDDLQLSEVARHVHVSSYHLCKMFKKVTGINFSNYVARLRVEAAKELLLKRRLRISEVAFESGFHSLGQFNKAFKRFGGESPRIYRERVSTVGQSHF